MTHPPLHAQALRRAPAPLTGVRVLDLTTVLAGPYSTYQLALLGAEVIKLEKPGGEWARQGTQTRAAPDLSAQFVAQNAGKKSIEINLKTDCGRAQALALMATCDVVVENFSPGVADRLPAAKVRTLPEVLAEDHVATRGTVQKVTDPYSGCALAVPSIGFKWNGAALGPAFGPPRLGEHTDAVLRALNIEPGRPSNRQTD